MVPYSTLHAVTLDTFTSILATRDLLASPEDPKHHLINNCSYAIFSWLGDNPYISTCMCTAEYGHSLT